MSIILALAVLAPRLFLRHCVCYPYKGVCASEASLDSALCVRLFLIDAAGRAALCPCKHRVNHGSQKSLRWDSHAEASSCLCCVLNTFESVVFNLEDIDVVGKSVRIHSKMSIALSN